MKLYTKWKDFVISPHDSGVIKTRDERLDVDAYPDALSSTVASLRVITLDYFRHITLDEFEAMIVEEDGSITIWGSHSVVILYRRGDSRECVGGVESTTELDRFEDLLSFPRNPVEVPVDYRYGLVATDIGRIWRFDKWRDFYIFPEDHGFVNSIEQRLGVGFRVRHERPRPVIEPNIYESTNEFRSALRVTAEQIPGVKGLIGLLSLEVSEYGAVQVWTEEILCSLIASYGTEVLVRIPRSPKYHLAK